VSEVGRVVGSVIVLLCTGNLCRSPMAAALLARELEARGLALSVRSAGLAARQGAPPPAEVVSVMAARGLDLAGHRSQPASAAGLAGAGLVLALARDHLRQAVVVAPEIWPRAFTLREAVRRSGSAGPRSAGQSLAAWAARLHAGRRRLDLLGDSPADDVADPMGGPLRGYEATAVELCGLTAALAAELAGLAWPGIAAATAGSPAE
jgi:protein-tyrosine phosphatase